MITEVSRLSEEKKELFAAEMSDIRRNHPMLVEYLQTSLAETVELISQEVRPEWLHRHSGAIADLQHLLGDINDPLSMRGQT